MPWQHPAERRKQRPISPRRLRTSNLTLQHQQLMPQQQDLDLLRPLAAKAEHDELEQSPQRPIEKRKSHASRTTRHRG
jgi:hypothetical protein